MRESGPRASCDERDHYDDGQGDDGRHRAERKPGAAVGPGATEAAQRRYPVFSAGSILPSGIQLPSMIFFAVELVCIQ